MTATYTLHDLNLIELRSPACREQLYAACERVGVERPNLVLGFWGSPSTRSTNLCQEGQHERCPMGGRPSGWRGPFRCWCLCHHANDGQRGGLPA